MSTFVPSYPAKVGATEVEVGVISTSTARIAVRPGIPDDRADALRLHEVRRRVEHAVQEAQPRVHPVQLRPLPQVLFVVRIRLRADRHALRSDRALDVAADPYLRPSPPASRIASIAAKTAAFTSASSSGAVKN